MKKYMKEFLKRGVMFAWGGPVILAIVWAFLKKANVVDMLTVNEVILGIVSTTVMAFIAAAVSAVYEIESLPKTFAGLIQMTVLYIDFLGFYVLNGWIPKNQIIYFTLIFVAAFIIIWCSIYIPIRYRVNKMNRMIENR